MLRELDVHPHTRRLVLVEVLSDGGKKTVVRDSSTLEVLGEVHPYYIPQGPRFSPEGDRLLFFGDGAIYIHDLVSKTTASIGDFSDLHASFGVWSPDGKRVVYNAYLVGEPDQKSPPSLYIHDVQSSSRRRLTNRPDAVDRFPQVSPDGKWVFFQRQLLHTPNMEKQIVLIHLETGEELAVPKGSDSSQVAGCFGWSDDSAAILIREVRDGTAFLRVWSVPERRAIESIHAPDLLGGAFRPGTNHIVALHKDEIALYALGEQSPIARVGLTASGPLSQTMLGPDWVADQSHLYYIADEGKRVYRWDYAEECIELVQAEEWPALSYRKEEYTILSRDGLPVPVLRFIPEAPRRLAVELVFGGPTPPVEEHHSLVRQLLQMGCEVVCPVYRGKIGGGPKHAQANIGEMGRADVWDVVECGADWKRRTGGDRPLVLAGFSYGGLLTLLALADRPGLWEAGVTFWGVTHLDHLGMFQSAYPSDPEQRESERLRRSPILQSRLIRTPLLILHGGLDTTSTNDEVAQLRDVLQSNGVPCELTIFEDDTHGLPRHREAMFAQVAAFLDRWVSGGEGTFCEEVTGP